MNVRQDPTADMPFEVEHAITSRSWVLSLSPDSESILTMTEAVTRKYCEKLLVLLNTSQKAMAKRKGRKWTAKGRAKRKARKTGRAVKKAFRKL